MAKQNSLLNTFTPNADGGGEKRRRLVRSLYKEGISWQGRNEKKKKEKKGLAELLTNDRAIGPLLDYQPEVGGGK